MSIIYDALKKIESQDSSSRPSRSEEKSKQIAQDIQTPEAPKLLPPLKVKSKTISLLSKNKPLLIAILLICLLVLGYVFFLAKMGSKREASPKLEKRELLPLPPRVYDGYVLEGIVYDDKVPLALINGKMYRLYDELDDYMILDISTNEVTLQNSKDQSTLQLTLPF